MVILHENGRSHFVDPWWILSMKDQTLKFARLRDCFEGVWNENMLECLFGIILDEFHFWQFWPPKGILDVTCKNELDVAHYSHIVNLFQGDEFNLVEVKEDEIRKKLPTYDKVFLKAFTFKDSFSSCLPIGEFTGVSEVVLKNGFNCDIS